MFIQIVFRTTTTIYEDSQPSKLRITDSRTQVINTQDSTKVYIDGTPVLDHVISNCPEHLFHDDISCFPHLKFTADLPPSKVHSHYPSPIGSSILEVITKGFYLLLYSIALGTISLSLLRLLFSKSL